MVMAIPFIIMAVGAVVGGIAANNAAKAQAKLQEAQGQQARRVSLLNAEIKQRENRREIGAAESAAGASGLSMTGSVLDVLNDMNLESDQEIALIKYGGQREQAAAHAQATFTKRAGQQALVGSLFKAGSSMAGAFGGAASAASAASAPSGGGAGGMMRYQ